MNKKKFYTGLKIIAFVFPCFFIGPSIFFKGSSNPENFLLKIIGVFIMFIAFFGAFFGLKKILDSIFDKNINE